MRRSFEFCCHLPVLNVVASKPFPLTHSVAVSASILLNNSFFFSDILRQSHWVAQVDLALMV